MKRFSLDIDDDLYSDWYRYYGSRGLRQTILRRIIRVMVARAKIRAGHAQANPTTWNKDYEDMTLRQIVDSIVEESRRYGELTDGND